MISSLRRPRSRVLLVVVLAALLASPAAHAQRAAALTAPTPAASPVAVAPPESAEMSAARLARLTALFKKEIEDKKLPGAVMLVARKGKLVHASALGVRDPKSADPMRTDAIFRIYSMTKPIVSVAAMMLVEDGTLQLTDPVASWLPAFKDGRCRPVPATSPPSASMTVVAVFMVQSAGALRVYHRNLFRQLVYQAIAE